MGETLAFLYLATCRYGNSDEYVKSVAAAARRLVDERLMQEEDVERVIKAATDWGRPLHDVRL